MLLSSLLLAGVLAQPVATSKAEKELSDLVPAVLSADYRGDRAELDRLDASLGKVPESPLDDYRAYWRGFARWRRAINGFNETPTPADMESDLNAAVGHFRTALEKRPGWIEARLAMVGCFGNLMYIAGGDAAKREKILGDYMPVGKSLRTDGRDNPRVLWIVGGLELAAPPPTGGDPVKAAATMRRGVEESIRESRSAAGPVWVPSWGGPENLMNLAYLYAHSATSDKALARAYAQGALVAVPEWHYVRDVLMPQIEAMTETGK